MADRLELRPPPREILLVMLSALGDAVHVLPVVNALRRKWPESRITWVIQPVPYELVRNHEAVDEFIVFKRRRGRQALRSYQELRHAFRIFAPYRHMRKVSIFGSTRVQESDPYYDLAHTENSM